MNKRSPAPALSHPQPLGMAIDASNRLTIAFLFCVFGNIDNLLNQNTYALTDLSGNGFAGIAFPDVGTKTLITMTAADTNDLSQGFFYGTPVPVGLESGAIHGLVAGDFDNDGVNEIAFAYNTGSSITAAIYRRNATTNPEGNKVSSLSLQQVGSISVPFSSVGNGFLTLTAGRNGGLPNPRIVLVYTNGNQTNVQPITVTPTSNPAQVTLTLAPLFTLAQNGTVGIFARGADFQTNGILRAAFTADPTDPSAGAWWQGTCTIPDVALAHPARWSFKLYAPSAPQHNCIPIATTSRNQDCVSFDMPQSDIWTSEFHWVKGLLITPAGSNGEGPQINRATVGEEILLQTRVYNYSLADVPSDSSIAVQFYGQPWNPNSLQSAGKAFLVDEIVLKPLPGFNSASSEGNKPNWALAGTTKLDTTPCVLDWKGSFPSLS